MTTGFLTDERTFWHTTGEHALVLPVGGWVQPPAAAGHAESPESKRRLKALMDVSGLSARLDVTTAPAASHEDLLRIHPAGYLQAFKTMSDARGGDLGTEAPFGPGSYEIAALSAGLALAAVEGVLNGRWSNAYSLSRPPGHHCLPDHPMGFCLLANIPVAIEAARARHGLGRIAVLDWDVHHGNGTEAIYLDDPDVLTISLHQEACFPPDTGGAGVRGAGGSNINVPLLPGGGHKAYLTAMDRIVLPALARFRPDIIIVASGFDANGCDPLARMLASSETFRVLTARLKAAAADLCGGRLVLVHEGGYAEAVVPFCGLAAIEELSGHRTPVEDPFLPLLTAQQPPADFDALQDRRLADQAKAVGL
jgi:acetoin utilization deacetylase AcuC-like enzyme